MRMFRLPLVLVGFGVLALAASCVWWRITYGDVIRYDYISAQQADACLLGDSDICRLARALCRGAHPISVVAYRAAAFWISLAALSASLVWLRGAAWPRPLKRIEFRHDIY